MLDPCGGRGGTTPSTPSVVDVTAIFTATRPTDAQSDSSAVVWMLATRKRRAQTSARISVSLSRDPRKNQISTEEPSC